MLSLTNWARFGRWMMLVSGIACISLALTKLKTLSLGFYVYG